MKRRTPPQKNRREFLKQTALGSVSVVFLRKAQLVRGASANERLNIAIIGAGGQGGSNTRAVSRENVIALCDVDERRAAGTFRRFRAAKKFRDFRSMLDALGGRLDAAVVSTPDHTHAVASVAAMKAGLHVYCEKPLTRTVHEARVMREVAAKEKVVTQMGNQGSASEGLRRGTELAWAGTIGEIRQAHVWFSGGNNPQDRPKDTPPVPKELAWDLWLGPASWRPYHPAYVPAAWRNWRAFGTGALGDFGCHSMNLAFRGLRLFELWKRDPAEKTTPRHIIRIEAHASDNHPETYPRQLTVRYRLPARGSMPPATLTWYNGGPKPPADLLFGHPMTPNGCLLVGTKRAIFSDCPWNTRSKLLPEKNVSGLGAVASPIPRSPGHHAEWLRACKGGPPPFSSFAIGGPLTELILLGHAAAIAGQALDYDPISGKVLNLKEENWYVERKYRSPWAL